MTSDFLLKIQAVRKSKDKTLPYVTTGIASLKNPGIVLGIVTRHHQPLLKIPHNQRIKCHFFFIICFNLYKPFFDKKMAQFGLNQTRGKTHSSVIVPIICSSMGIAHPGIALVRASYGPLLFDVAADEVLTIIPTLHSLPRIVRDGAVPYVHPDDQNAIIERVFDAYGLSGSFQRIQTVVATEAAALELARAKVHLDHQRAAGTTTSTSQSTTMVVTKRDREDITWKCPAPGCRLSAFKYCMVTGKLHPSVCDKCGTTGRYIYCPAAPRGTMVMHADMTPALTDTTTEINATNASATPVPAEDQPVLSCGRPATPEPVVSESEEEQFFFERDDNPHEDEAD